jgi:hypothetical protein
VVIGVSALLSSAAAYFEGVGIPERVVFRKNAGVSGGAAMNATRSRRIDVTPV